MLVVELRRALSPESMGVEHCAICGRYHVPYSVMASVCVPESREYLGTACEACVEHLGDSNPEEFPTIAELREAVREYPEPVFATEAEAERVDEEDPEAYREAVVSTLLDR